VRTEAHGRKEAPRHTGALDRVGMSGIETRVLLLDERGSWFAVPARADAFVSLDRPADKGIHMSRLFLALDRTLEERELSPRTLELALARFLESHEEQTSSAFVRVEYEQAIRRNSLVSDNAGWRIYPIELGGRKTTAGTTFEFGTQITYSSACPCSGVLARDLTRKRFLDSFSGDTVSREQVARWLGTQEGMGGCPHSQRSHGTVKVRFSDPDSFVGTNEFIDRLEASIKTVVQAAVKREDEQAFARLNAENLMFCEDAARNMMHVVEQMEGITDYWIEARHFESLHPHDAVSVVTKGIAGGFQPETAR